MPTTPYRWVIATHPGVKLDRLDFFPISGDTLEVSSSEVDSVEIPMCKVGSLEICTLKVSLYKITSSEVSFLQVSSFKVNPLEVSSFKTCSSKVWLQVRTAQVPFQQMSIFGERLSELIMTASKHPVFVNFSSDTKCVMKVVSRTPLYRTNSPVLQG